MAYSLAVQLDARAHALIEAAGGTADATPKTATEALVRGSLAVNKYGTPTFALMSEDLYAAAAEAPASDAPVGAAIVPPITPSDSLPDSTVIVGTRSAARLLTFEPPVRVEAVNIPNGGIDAGLFSYSAGIVELAAGVVAYTVTPGGALARK
jgi:hypothetical protein